MPDAFETRFGFPRSAVTLGNWRTRPCNAWSFWNVAELVPTATIAADPAEAAPSGAEAEPPSGTLPSGESATAFLERGFTDELLVLRDGAPVWSWRAAHVDAGRRHIIFSITKSVTAILAGMLEDDGRLDPAAPVTDVLPEAAGSAWADASLRDVLDMRVSIDFDETYADPDSTFLRYRRAMLWNPPEPGQLAETLADCLFSMRKGARPHGGPFRYRSPNSDLLGLLVERAAGMRLVDFASEHLWKPLGMVRDGLITVDAAGTARTAGGGLMTAGQLARIGEMMRLDGSFGGRRIVSERWVRDATTAGDRDAWLAGDFPYLFPSGSYRGKWYASGDDTGAFCGIGIHGQWLWVDPRSRVTIVRFASQPEAVDDPLDQEVVDFFRWTCARLARSGGTG